MRSIVLLFLSFACCTFNAFSQACVGITFPNAPCSFATFDLTCCTPGAVSASWMISDPGGNIFVLSGCQAHYTSSEPGLFNVMVEATLANGSVLYGDTTFVIPDTTPFFALSIAPPCSSPFAYLNACNADVINYQWTLPFWAVIDSASVDSCWLKVDVTDAPPGTTQMLVVLNGLDTASGCALTTYKSVSIQQPHADFALSTDSGCAPLSGIQLDNNSTGATAWLWILTNLQTGAAVTSNGYDPWGNPITVLPDLPAGNHTLALVAKMGSASDPVCWDTMVKLIQVQENPEPSFSALNSPYACSAPHTVCFQIDSFNSELNYNWNFGGAVIGPVDSTTACVTYNATGSFPVSLTVTNANGCSNTLTDPGFVTIGAPSVVITADEDSVFINDLVTLTGSTATSYSWNVMPSTGFNVVDTAGASIQLQFLSTGIYSVCLTATFANGCTASSCTDVSVIDTLTSVHDLNDTFNVDVFPNPANDIVSFKTKHNTSGSIKVDVWSVEGRKLIEQTLSQQNGTNEYLLNVSGLRNGVYILQIHTINLSGFRKLVIQR